MRFLKCSNRLRETIIENRNHPHDLEAGLFQDINNLETAFTC